MNKTDLISATETILQYLATLGKGECHVIIRKNSSAKSDGNLFPITSEDFRSILAIWQKLVLAEVKSISVKSGKDKFTLRTNLSASEDLGVLASVLSDLTGIEIIKEKEETK